MIFLTVGTQLPFDRLVRCVDEWAGAHPSVPIFGQIGPASYQPRHFAAVDFLPPSEVDYYFQTSDLIVAHAGMGTILSSLVLRKPLVILPRRQALGEHRSDHQMTTALWLRRELQLNTAFECDELAAMLDHRAELKAGQYVGETAQACLVDAVRDFVGRAQVKPSVVASVRGWSSALRKSLHDFHASRGAGA